MNQANLNKLNEMHLLGMERALRNIGIGASCDGMTSDEIISMMIQAEWEHRQNQKVERCLKAASFRYQANIENIDFKPTRGLDRNTVMRLAEGSYIDHAENIAITGLTGVGKSYLATALGRQACLQGRKVLYKNAQKLFAQLKVASIDGTYARELDKIAKKDLFILDDFAMEVLDHKSSLALLEILEDRIGQKSMIIASQVPMEKWYEIISDKTVADACMDRIVSSSHKIILKGESMRTKK